MQSYRLAAALVAALILSTTARAATVVTFDRPERFTDVDDDRTSRATNLATLEKQLVALGTKYLPADDDLRITITDVDLAGRARFTSRGASPEIRVIDGQADWPRIKLTWTRTHDGTTTGPTSETIVDQNYLDFGPRPDLTRPLPYEQRMLERWFAKRFGGEGASKR